MLITHKNHNKNIGDIFDFKGSVYIVSKIIDSDLFEAEIYDVNPSNSILSEYKTDKGEAIRFNQDKLKYEYVNPQAHRDMVEVLTYGSKKYYPRNWEKGFSWTSVIGSLKRHIEAWERGEDYDPDSGLLHMAHVAANAHYLNAFYYIFPQGDDRPKPFLRKFRIGLDIDGVLANFTKGWNKLFPEAKLNPETYSYHLNMGDNLDKMVEEKSINDFYLELEPLISPKEMSFEPVCYITSRPCDTEITEKWLEKHNFPLSPVYTVNGESKVDIAKKQNIDVFIDDSFDNFVELNNAGIFTYLYSAPWNMKYDVGHMRINNLKDIMIFK